MSAAVGRTQHPSFPNGQVPTKSGQPQQPVNRRRRMSVLRVIGNELARSERAAGPGEAAGFDDGMKSPAGDPGP